MVREDLKWRPASAPLQRNKCTLTTSELFTVRTPIRDYSRDSTSSGIMQHFFSSRIPSRDRNDTLHGSDETWQLYPETLFFVEMLGWCLRRGNLLVSRALPRAARCGNKARPTDISKPGEQPWHIYYQTAGASGEPKGKRVICHGPPLLANNLYE